MFVPLPNLDDRRWADLVDEGRSLIPVFAPIWTDFNAHDPGITLLELFAWIAETEIYRVDQIPDSHIRAYLSLIGIQPLPPKGARAVVEFNLKKTATQEVKLPAQSILNDPADQCQFSLRQKISVQPSTLVAVQVESGGKFRDLTADWQRGKPLSLLGDNPSVSDCLYLGFDRELKSGAHLSLFFEMSGERAGACERQRLLEQAEGGNQSLCGVFERCDSETPVKQSASLPSHHSLHLQWEVQTQPDFWEPMDVLDDTRSLSLSGAVVATLSDDAPQIATGVAAKSYAYIRARVVSGLPDAAPLARRVLANAVEVEQYTPLWEDWTVATGVVAVGMPPLPGHYGWLYFDVGPEGQLSSLEFAAPSEDALYVRMLGYKPATNAQEGRLTVEAVRAGSGAGAPNQSFHLNTTSVREKDFQLYALEMGGLRKCRRRETFNSSGPADLDYLLDAGNANIKFGDGQHGRVPPVGSILFAIASGTLGAKGNVAAQTISELDTGAHNAALIGDVCLVANKFESIRNLDPASGGADTEPLTHAEGRAVQILQEPSRAVTLSDCEALALRTPGTQVARATAIANHHPRFQCYSAPGFITLVIVPSLPAGRPVPSTGLLQAVTSYLKPRQVIGTRVEVTGPSYLEIAVIAQVKAYFGQDKNAVAKAVTSTLEKFFDPLSGGPDGRGWPLGGDVYISEVFEAIAKVPGVDHVLKVELLTPGCGAQCGNVCLQPLALTVSGTHQITVK